MDEHEPINTLAIIAGQYDCVAEVVAERDRLRAVVDDVDLQAARDAVTHLEATIAERDRLRAVVDAARRMHGLIRGDHVIGDDECAMAIDAIVDAVDQLDESEDMGASTLPVGDLRGGEQADAEQAEGVPPVADHQDGDEETESPDALDDQ